MEQCLAKKVSESQKVLDAIRRIVRELRTFSKATEKEFGLSSAQIYVLQKLVEAKTPLSVNELAEATLTHQSSVSVVVSKLAARKLLERTADPQDSRSVRLAVTKQGEYLFGKSPISIQERITKSLSEMTPTQRKGLVEGLHALIQNAGMDDDEAPMLMEEDAKSQV
jgi:DNA-binding MarR family transcriptional regulator